jgi:branched-chain amino acid aminotransferase
MSVKFEIEPATTPTSEKERAAKLVDPGFGRIFTDHMALVRYNQGQGWHSARVESRANFPLDPATAVLHYAQEIFEGLKAYKRDDGGVNLFRPDANARRFRNSAERMAMAPLPEPVFIEAVEELVRIDRAWMPGGEGSLYLRPFMIASEVFLGVKPSAEYTFAVIASPVGSYFKGGPAPVSIWVSENYTRAAIGGTGAVKCGGTRWHERLLRLRRWFAVDAAAWHDPAGHHPRFDHRAGEGFRHACTRGGLLDRPMAR